jgi:PAS domain S-box-containing protein
MKPSQSSEPQATISGDQDFYKLLFEAAPDAILVVDAAGVIRRNNSEAERMLSAKTGQLIGMLVENLVPPASRTKHKALRDNFANDPHKRPMGLGRALQALKLNGDEFPVEISLAPAQSSTGLLSGGDVIVILRDVSERLRARRTEYELQRAKALAYISGLILHEREIGKVLSDISEATRLSLKADFAGVVKLDSGQLRPLYSSKSIVLDTDLVKWLDVINQYLPVDGFDQPVPTVIGDAAVADQGRYYSYGDTARSFMIVPLVARDYADSLLVVASNEPNRFASEDVGFVETIANIVSNYADRQYAEEKYLLSQRLESIGQLTGGVAHDFNNLLTVIGGNLEILTDAELKDPYFERAVKAALKATQQGSELTSKLLAFSRRQTLRPEAIDVSDTIATLSSLLNRTIGGGIEIHTSVPKDTPHLSADRLQLETALLNLAVNARDAMPNGGMLKIEATEQLNPDLSGTSSDGELRPGHYVRICVTDNGIGMSKAVMARVFEPFFTTKSTGKGSGLGLSMVYGFAKQSAGHVNIYSEPNIGTTVSMYLPVSETAYQKSKPLKTRSVKKGTESVLIIEDDEAVRNVAVQHLTALGYKTSCAHDLDSAIKALQGDLSIALIFADVILGDRQTGPSVVSELLKIKSTMRVVMTSGYAKSALPPELSKGHQFEFLHKPYTRQQLAQVIRSALDASVTPNRPMASS